MTRKLQPYETPVFIQFHNGEAHEAWTADGDVYDFDWSKRHNCFLYEETSGWHGNVVTLYPFTGMSYWLAAGFTAEVDPEFSGYCALPKRIKRIPRKLAGGRLFRDSIDVSGDGRFWCSKCQDNICGDELCEHSRWCEHHSMFCYPGEICCWILEENQFGEPTRWMEQVGDTIGEQKSRHHPKWYKFRVKVKGKKGKYRWKQW